MTTRNKDRIKDPERYEALRDQGVPKSKAARIANTRPSKMSQVQGGKAYEDWTRDELYKKAKSVGIAGRASMRKHELIQALRRGA